jgi:hypothetical protein
MRTASRMLQPLFEKSIKSLVILTLVAGIVQFSSQLSSISQFLSPEKRGALPKIRDWSYVNQFAVLFQPEKTP